MKIVLNCHSEYAYVKAYPRHTPKATVLRINIPIDVENGLYQMIFFYRVYVICREISGCSYIVKGLYERGSLCHREQHVETRVLKR